jgi:hypothetical protein
VGEMEGWDFSFMPWAALQAAAERHSAALAAEGRMTPVVCNSRDLTTKRPAPSGAGR